jgi:hypothetical protein
MTVFKRCVTKIFLAKFNDNFSSQKISLPFGARQLATEQKLVLAIEDLQINPGGKMRTNGQDTG